MKYLGILLLFISAIGCRREDPPADNNPGNPSEPVPELYFPDNWTNAWSTEDPERLGWNTGAIPSLYSFLDGVGTRGFIVLRHGKIVLEHYNGQQLNGQAFSNTSQWYWASAGKSLVGFAAGIAHSRGQLDLSAPVSQYLGTGWTSIDSASEWNITVEHQLSMSTGIDYNISNLDCTQPSCFDYLNPPGTAWYYHNGVYTKTHDLLASATGTSFEQFVGDNIQGVIGMSGSWYWLNDNHVFFSNARSMARFGLLVLGEGRWKTDTVLTSKAYFDAMISSSQPMNPAYGYLWWLNGQGQFQLPSSTATFSGNISEEAPDDMVAALGMNSQVLCVVPSEGLVVVRMGEDPSTDLVPLNFLDDLWEHLNAVMHP